jgi:DNA-binding CsgD family transcriptional regulator
MGKQQDLLSENEGKRLDFRLPMLVCLSMFVVWQMGIMFFTGTTLSLDGKTPIPFPINSNIVTVLVAAGYILSVAHLTFFQRYCVITARVGVGAALLSALALYLPFAPGTLAVFLYFQGFSCAFLIGIEIAIIINLFTERAEIRDLIVTLILPGCLIAFLHNGIIPVPFSLFQHFTVIALAMLLVFYYKMPSKVWPEYVRRSSGIVKPKSLMFGLSALIWFSSLITLFGLVVAESITYGVIAYYIFIVLSGVILAVLWKYYKIIPLKSASAMVAAGTFGFVAAIASLFIPALSLPACALLGFGGTVCWMSSYFGIVMARRYPSRFICPGLTALAFTAVIIHTVVLEALRDNLTMLYAVYLVIAMALTIVYLMLEPYMGYSFRSRTFQDIIGVVADETEEETAGPQSAPVKRASLLVKTETPRPIAPKDVSLHERRMKILMTHALLPLTNREYQLADCIMRGLRRSEIAQEMGVEPDSITKYSNRIYNKFDIHRRQDLFKLAEKLEREWDEA